VRARPRAFVSHSSKDLPFARRLAERLRAYGIDVWLDDLQLKVGALLTETIAGAVRQHDFLIVVVSKASRLSPWVRKEIQMAAARTRRRGGACLVPVLLERPGGFRLPASLRDTKYVDFSDHKTFEIGLAELLDLLDEGLPARRARGIERIEFIGGDQLNAALKRNIERILFKYQAYTRRLGYRSKNRAFEIEFDSTTELISSYDVTYDRIVTNIQYAGEEDYLRRDYTHHALAMARTDLWNRAGTNWNLAAVESGLAAYFPCSFKGNHLFGSGAAHLTGQREPFFDLTNNRHGSEIANTTESVATDGLEVWGGAFWRLRAELGANIADRLLWHAWLAVRPRARALDREFIRSLMRVDAQRHERRYARHIKEVFAERGLPLNAS
jgi:hypothetical protein